MPTEGNDRSTELLRLVSSARFGLGGNVTSRTALGCGRRVGGYIARDVMVIVPTPSRRVARSLGATGLVALAMLTSTGCSLVFEPAARLDDGGVSDAGPSDAASHDASLDAHLDAGHDSDVPPSCPDAGLVEVPPAVSCGADPCPPPRACTEDLRCTPGLGLGPPRDHGGARSHLLSRLQRSGRVLG